MQNKEKLERLNKEIRKCRKCSLYKTRKNAVPGEGSFNAKVFVLGQAPGAKEDESGRPFVGRAGRLLTELLKICGLNRDKVFITSPVKCFPPKNRKPSREEIKSCFLYLKKQIETINPKKIILLGEVAFKTFFPNKKMADFRGKTIKKDGKQYFIVYHPAAGIRFQKFKKILEKDFKKISKYF